MLNKIKPFLILMRPANIVTAIADILAGVSVTGLIIGDQLIDIIALVIGTIGLYGGGVVFNDIFDRTLDGVERPERPLPSGKVELWQAQILGIALYMLGSFAALMVSKISAIIALLIVVFSLLYNKYAKHHILFGPLNMGLCRGFNLLLGISLSVVVLKAYWFLAIIPIIFIAGITLTSQGENSGENASSIILALVVDSIIVALFFIFHRFNDYNFFTALPFICFWFILNFQAKIRAIRTNEAEKVKIAVKVGVLSLIPLNAGIASGFGGGYFGLLILALLPFSIFLSKYFSVT
ncbi:MAG: UbiA-like protein EboC [Saprospiraceae bacterium]|nr:UbiA-like protein EboC [Saprospiraceae bacterium]